MLHICSNIFVVTVHIFNALFENRYQTKQKDFSSEKPFYDKTLKNKCGSLQTNPEIFLLCGVYGVCVVVWCVFMCVETKYLLTVRQSFFQAKSPSMQSVHIYINNLNRNKR